MHASACVRGRGHVALLAAAALLVSLLPLLPSAASPASAQTAADLFFSEYVEGTSNNKALEIANFTGAPVDLAAAGYSVQMFFNGSPSAGLTINLTGTVASGDVFVLAHSSASASILAVADQTNGAGWFNGDDAVVLRRGTTHLDVIGQIGVDPGTEWGTGLTSTADNTLRRKPNVTTGDPDGTDAFDPAVEWDGYATDTFDGLGSHTVSTRTGAPVVISQVYGAGGNSGATLNADYVELFNRSDAPVDLGALSIQYASATGTGPFGSTVTLSGTLQPGRYFLVGMTPGANGAPLPTPDATGMISMAAGAGKVALVTGSTSLGCNGGSAPCDADQLARIVDLVGYGNANFFEGAGAAPTLTATLAAFRAEAGCTDTNNNAADFSTATPAPRTSATAANLCGGGGTDPDPDPDPDPEPVDICEATVTKINAIQGSGASTPIPGQEVVTRGVVTADFTSGGASGTPANQGLRGFFMEAIPADRDNDPETSEGVFVFDGAGAFAGGIGDLVTVAGTAGEFNAVTQVTASELRLCGTEGIDTTLPAPAALPLPTHPSDRGTVFEPLESMRVTHPELTVVEFFQIERFGEIRLSSGGVLPNPTNVVDPRDDAAYNAQVAFNAANNIVLDDGRTGQNLDPLPYVVPGDTLRIGDQLRSHTTVLHFGFNEWRLQPVDIGAITEELRTNRTRPRPEQPPQVGGNLTVASFNVLNYFNGDPNGTFPTTRGAVTASEFARQTEKIVDAIVRMDADVLGLIEIENDEGPGQATEALVNAINAELGAPVYAFIDTGRIGTDEIKLALIYKSATVAPRGAHAILDSSVDPRFEDSRSRPVLAQTFEDRSTGRGFTVAVNHLKSKGSACLPADNDPRQGNCNGVRDRAAAAMVDWLRTNPTGQPSVGTLIIGDLNAYAQEDPIRTLEAGGYTDLLEKFSDGEMPYTYTFDATQGYLDHALADSGLLPYVTDAAAWNINADEVPAIDYLESCCGISGNQRFRTAEVARLFYDPSAFRSSDHDPVMIGLAIPGCPGSSQSKGNARGRDACPGASEGRGNGAIGFAPGSPR
jgi:uncharacterized protein